MNEPSAAYDDAAQQTVDLGNQVADANPDADVWEIADGVLAGAIQYWLYSRQPCEDRGCEDCAPLSTAEHRLAELRELVDELARDSDYFHTPNDANVGRA